MNVVTWTQTCSRKALLSTFPTREHFRLWPDASWRYPVLQRNISCSIEKWFALLSATLPTEVLKNPAVMWCCGCTYVCFVKKVIWSVINFYSNCYLYKKNTLFLSTRRRRRSLRTSRWRWTACRQGRKRIRRWSKHIKIWRNSGKSRCNPEARCPPKMEASPPKVETRRLSPGTTQASPEMLKINQGATPLRLHPP